MGLSGLLAILDIERTFIGNCFNETFSIQKETVQRPGCHVIYKFMSSMNGETQVESTRVDSY